MVQTGGIIMIGITETLTKYRGRTVGDVIKFKDKLYVIVAIGKMRTEMSGTVEAEYVIQSPDEDDTPAEITTPISEPVTFDKADWFRVLNYGDFVAIKNSHQYVQVKSIYSYEWSGVDLKVRFLSEPVRPWSQAEVQQAISRYRVDELKNNHQVKVKQNVISLDFTGGK